MLTKNTPDTIPATLTIKAQGQQHTLKLTYHNHKPDKYDEFVKNENNLQVPEGVSHAEGIAHINAQIVLFLVKSFDDGTDKEFPLNLDGMLDLERHWPGMLMGIMQGYHRSRGAAIEKN